MLCRVGCKEFSIQLIDLRQKCLEYHGFVKKMPAKMAFTCRSGGRRPALHGRNHCGFVKSNERAAAIEERNRSEPSRESGGPCGLLRISFRQRCTRHHAPEIRLQSQAVKVRYR